MGGLILGLIGALIGASSVLASGLLAESYRRHRDRNSAASAIAGEISNDLAVATKRKVIEVLKAAKTKLEAGEKVVILNLVEASGTGLDPVAERHLDRLGLLSENRLPERLVTFYSNVIAIRVDISELAHGTWDDHPQGKIDLIGADLALWDETKELGRQLCIELRNIGAEPWWPVTVFHRVCDWPHQFWIRLTYSRRTVRDGQEPRQTLPS